MARILFVNLPYAGHTNPTLPLAGLLVKNGHRVAYINAPEWRDKIAATGAEFLPYLDYPEGLGEQQKNTRCFPAAYHTAMAVGGGFDLLVYEMLFYPARQVAERLGLPRVRQFSQIAWNPDSYAEAKRLAPLYELSCKLLERKVMGPKTARALDMQGVDMVGAILADAPPLNIVYLPEELQPCRESFGGSYLFAGPPAVAAPGAAGGIDYAALPRPLVYISMGSIMSSRIFVKRCLRAFGGKPLSVILATGRVAPESLGPLPSNILALPFAPQTEILQRADLFITHCGMNSVNEALYSGVPMLALPVLNDQPINAAGVERLGVARKMRAFPTTAGLLYRNTMEALADAGLGARAKQMRQSVRACPGAAGAAAAVEDLLGGL